jgi:DNA-binding NtrC family response regulator
MSMRSILIVEEDAVMRELLVRNLSRNGHQIFVTETGGGALRLLDQKPFDLVVSAVRLPDLDGLRLLDAVKASTPETHVILTDRSGSVQHAVEAMKKGAFDYLPAPFPQEVLDERIENALGGRRQEVREPEPLKTAPARSASPLVLTRNRRVKEMMDLCQRVAPSKAAVLIQGESGTGKELFARYIHGQSARGKGPFVAVNCAALPEHLLESELFGHEKGAFTGAVARKVGKFELADRGTLLLDEVSEMDVYLQAKLLRVLQEGEVDRVGGREPVPIDVRIIATTNREIEASIAKGEFREDLYYRLNVIPIRLPALRERPEDIEPLAVSFLSSFSETYGRPPLAISGEAMDWLRKQPWRGNVRELRNLMERMALVCPGPALGLRDLCPGVEGTGWESPCVPPPAGEAPDSLCLRDMEKKMIYQALEKTDGNRTHAARILGISIRTLRNKLNEYREGLVCLEA